MSYLTTKLRLEENSSVFAAELPYTVNFLRWLGLPTKDLFYFSIALTLKENDQPKLHVSRWSKDLGHWQLRDVDYIMLKDGKPFTPFDLKELRDTLAFNGDGVLEIKAGFMSHIRSIPDNKTKVLYCVGGWEEPSPFTVEKRNEY